MIPETTKYKVKYTLNGGSIEGTGNTTFYDPETFEKNAIVTVDLFENDEIYKDGCEFKGWKDSVTGEIYTYGDTFVMPDNNVTLTAVWELDT